MATRYQIKILLRATRTLLRTEKQWTRDKRARNKQGELVDPTDFQACCWCLTGALERTAKFMTATKIDHVDLLVACCIALSENIPELFPNRDQRIYKFNDDSKTTFEDIIKLTEYTLGKFEEHD